MGVNLHIICSWIDKCHTDLPRAALDKMQKNAIKYPALPVRNMQYCKEN